ncbi:hypothetical protein Tco_0749164 [Tanacetum coccineum]|uniref:Uncharacterized protein n=1 Tax=Tanacetum coccineum TaxID=301880 RepID=A0ABQ4Z0M8_9ASTR
MAVRNENNARDSGRGTSQRGPKEKRARAGTTPSDRKEAEDEESEPGETEKKLEIRPRRWKPDSKPRAAAGGESCKLSKRPATGRQIGVRRSKARTQEPSEARRPEIRKRERHRDGATSGKQARPPGIEAHENRRSAKSTQGQAGGGRTHKETKQVAESESKEAEAEGLEIEMVERLHADGTETVEACTALRRSISGDEDERAERNEEEPVRSQVQRTKQRGRAIRANEEKVQRRAIRVESEKENSCGAREETRYSEQGRAVGGTYRAQAERKDGQRKTRRKGASQEQA